ncbi:DUF1657 domain-containing protein [Virgibacillus oceani]|uniref:DUF1657 domain-containing protein n=1 Tax=Virgibacillus oceani TaxID=1479511 RepID=A0A917M066_9BACI|nr:DUF1657 domain-containing protein [Virgibacillus oceani]GGG70552.1 hypothetical protein GCM10011398_13350 [Virgibacillus oceani]
MTVGSQVKACFSSLKSADATLGILANKTQSDQARDAFSDVQKIVSEVKDDLQKQVIRLSKEEPQYKS